jgi:site-specific recombinase XerD
LLEDGFTPFSVNNRICWLAWLSAWLEARKIPPKRLKESQLDAFIRSQRRLNRPVSRKSIEPLIRALAGLGVVPKPRPVKPPVLGAVDRALAPYVTYLRDERALSEVVVRGYTDVARSFQVSRFGNRTPRWEALRAEHLTDFVIAKVRRYQPGTVGGWVSALRSLVRYLHVSGVIPADLTGAIPGIHHPRLSGLPSGLEPDHVLRLLRAPDRRSRVGSRDYALLLLLCRLGLRCREVTALRLEDIDWQIGELMIRGKGRKLTHLPLPEDVGTAIAQYLRRGRPDSSLRSVFLGSRVPFKALSSHGLTNVVRARAVDAGLAPFGAHRLRHTLATRILQKGGSLDEIAHVLRHASHDTTAIYAKVDLEALRSVAQPWPGGTL